MDSFNILKVGESFFEMFKTIACGDTALWLRQTLYTINHFYKQKLTKYRVLTHLICRIYILKASYTLPKKINSLDWLTMLHYAMSKFKANIKTFFSIQNNFNNNLYILGRIPLFFWSSHYFLLILNYYITEEANIVTY